MIQRRANSRKSVAINPGGVFRELHLSYSPHEMHGNQHVAICRPVMMMMMNLIQAMHGDRMSRP